MFSNHPHSNEIYTMSPTKDEYIVSSLIDDTFLQNNQTGYGLVIRFGFHAWNGNHWKTHQRVMQANTILLKILEQHDPIYISRSSSGCEAVFHDSNILLQAAIEIQQCIHQGSIPATIVVYKDEGHLAPDVWISSLERQAECIAFWGEEHEIIVMPSAKENLVIPVGVGLLPASKYIQNKFHVSLWTLHVYQDEE